VWSNDPETYASSSIATGWICHVGHVKGDDSDKKGHTGPPGWELGCEANLTCVKIPSLLRSLMLDPRWIILENDEGK
jgi:hypothetical protein